MFCIPWIFRIPIFMEHCQVRTLFSNSTDNSTEMHIFFSLNMFFFPGWTMHFGTLWYCDLCYQWEDVLSSQTYFLLQGYEYVQFMLTIACINHTSIDKDLTSNQPLVCLANVNINIETLMKIIPDPPKWDAQNAASICCPLLTIPIPIYIYIIYSICKSSISSGMDIYINSVWWELQDQDHAEIPWAGGWIMMDMCFFFFATNGGRWWKRISFCWKRSSWCGHLYLSYSSWSYPLDIL